MYRIHLKSIQSSPDTNRPAGLNLLCHTIESSHTPAAVIKYLHFFTTGTTWPRGLPIIRANLNRPNKNGAVLQRSLTQLVPWLSKRRNNGASPTFHPAFFLPCRLTPWTRLGGSAGAFPKTANDRKHQTPSPTRCRTDSTLSHYWKLSQPSSSHQITTLFHNGNNMANWPAHHTCKFEQTKQK